MYPRCIHVTKLGYQIHPLLKGKGGGGGGVRGVHISKYIHPSGELPDHLQVTRYSLTWAVWICATPKGLVFQLC